MHTVDWSSYARNYDMLLDHSTPYQEILERFRRFVATRVSDGAAVLEIGAGTGNYIVAAGNSGKNLKLTAIEPDPVMATALEVKARGAGLTVEIYREEYSGSNEQFDCIVCVHALYTMPDPRKALRDMRKQLRPGGIMFMCDLGRLMDVNDWRSYFVRHLLKTAGIAKTAQILWQSRDIAKQNFRVRAEQDAGRYWTHTTEEFRAELQVAGFTVESCEPIYRGYSDLAICS